ncbi:leucine-rich repeat domain-containing protein [Lachnospiraceae bacterium NSJ-171]|nr:leucine-rich repeat domain-containing protein [Lachnospiraceae bacterium NSJ-171]
MKKTRKIITYTLIMLSLIILYSGNIYAAKKVKNIQSYVWVKDKIVIGKGNRASLKQYGFYTVYSKKNKLESSNNKIATVNKYGLVKGKKTGTVVITKYKTNKQGRKIILKKCKVTIKKKIPIDDKFTYTVKTDETGADYISDLRYIGCETDVTIPAYINGIPVKKLDDSVFLTDRKSKDKFSGISVPEDIEKLYIEDGITYVQCVVRLMENVKEIRLPKTLETLDGLSFKECGQLKKLNFNVIFKFGIIPERMFSSALDLDKPLIIPGNVKTIGRYAFDGAGVKKVILEEGVEIIDQGAFSFSDVTKIEIPESMKIIGELAFQNCKLKNVTIKSGDIRVGTTAFDKNVKVIYK